MLLTKSLRISNIFVHCPTRIMFFLPPAIAVHSVTFLKFTVTAVIEFSTSLPNHWWVINSIPVTWMEDSIEVASPVPKQHNSLCFGTEEIMLTDTLNASRCNEYLSRFHLCRFFQSVYKVLNVRRSIGSNSLNIMTILNGTVCTSGSTDLVAPAFMIDSFCSS